MKKKDSLDEFFDETSLPKDVINNTSKEINEEISLDTIKTVLAEANEVEQPRKRKRRTKAELDTSKEDNEARLKQIEIASMSFSLIGLTRTIAYALNNPLWSIEDETEANFLAQSTINFLDKIYPDWRKTSPIVEFISAWSSYFAKRLLTAKKVK